MQLLINESAAMFHWTLEKKAIMLKLQAEPGMVYVYNDGIHQVISNLLDNAIRYHDGSEAIIVSGARQRDSYRLSISGYGKPIPQTEKNKVFERFYRADPSRTREFGGTGLGLAISKEIIEHHNGVIGLESNGTYHTFWFELPVCL